MKKYINKVLLLVGVSVLLLSSCKKQETEIYYKSGTSPVLTASLSDSIPLIFQDSLSNAITFSWTNPNYVLSNGVNSSNVTYYLEIDTLGANFTNPNMQQIAISSSLTSSITVKDLNTILAGAAKLGLAFSQKHSIQVKIVSFLGTNQAEVSSNVLNFSVIPYPPPAAVTPPPTSTLYIVGSAVVGGWSNPIPTPDIAAQQFTQISTTEYKLTTTLISGQEYKFIGKNDGAWASTMNFGIATKDDPTEINGGAFIASGGSNNIMAPSTSVSTTLYDIDVNFQTGKFTVTLH